MTTKQSVTLISVSALAAGVAKGAIVYSGPLNLQQNFTTDNYRQTVDMTGDGVSDFSFGYETAVTKPYVDARTSIGTTTQSGMVSLFARPNRGLPVTPAGTTIDLSYATTYPGNTADPRAYMYYDDQGSTVIGDWPNTAVTDAYVGIKVDPGNGTHYGWLHFIDNPTAATPNLTLVDWAYESDPGVGLATGVVPEPATGALAGLGLAGWLMLRKRRQSA